MTSSNQPTESFTFGDKQYDIPLFEAVKPKDDIDPPSSNVLSKGHVKEKGYRPLPLDILFEHNQEFKTRDGITLRADIFRPVGDEKVPALVQWSPYGKTGVGQLNLASAPLRVGVPVSQLSGYESFEGFVFWKLYLFKLTRVL